MAALVVLTLSMSAGTLAGDLDPPAGPVGSTMKPLDEVEPRVAINGANTPGDADSLFRIAQPGSYYLTGNVIGESGKHGIEIVASGVTLDLMGFQLQGVAGSLDGVILSMSASNIRVYNGTARDWGGEGVDLNQANNSRAERLRVSNNGGTGLQVGSASQVLHCEATANALSGFTSATRCTFTACIATGNGTGASIAHGISTGTDCVVSDCDVAGNGAGAGGGNGIFTGSGGRVCDCSVISNGNSATADNDGIRVGSGSLVSNCLVITNRGDGIQTGFESLVIGNNCIANGLGGNGAGIHTTNGDNRIEGNNCTGADRGIDVDAAGNVIVRNTCSGNILNWDVAAGNVILVVNATTAAAVSGNSGGTAPGSTDPNANFTY